MPSNPLIQVSNLGSATLSRALDLLYRAQTSGPKVLQFEDEASIISLTCRSTSSWCFSNSASLMFNLGTFSYSGRLLEPLLYLRSDNAFAAYPERVMR